MNDPDVQTKDATIPENMAETAEETGPENSKNIDDSAEAGHGDANGNGEQKLTDHAEAERAEGNGEQKLTKNQMKKLRKKERALSHRLEKRFSIFIIFISFDGFVLSANPAQMDIIITEMCQRINLTPTGLDEPD